MIFRSILWMSIALASAGCGLKGPLYLPDRGKQDASERASEEQEQKKEQDRATTPSGPQTPVIPTDTSPSTTPPPLGN